MFWKKKNKIKINGERLSVLFDAADHTAINVVIKTDLGNIRTNNEDSASFFRITDENIIREKGCLLIVADGMGGHQAGEVASKMAVETISQEYFKQNNNSGIEKSLIKAFSNANKKIFEMASASEQHRGMGTTCTAVVIRGQQVYYAHAGDSRAYLYKNKSISRLTEDHTYVQELVNSGDITPQEADTHPQRNILTNAMGTKPSLRVDTGKSELTFDQNDRILVCTDGLYDYMNDTELASILNYILLEDAADYLIAEAKRRGGKDNITVALAEKTTSIQETNLKMTRDVDVLKLTQETDLPNTH